MRFVVYLALFVFPSLVSAGLFDFLFSEPARPTWNCVYRGSNGSFTLKDLTRQDPGGYILIDSKYKVFYRRTEEPTPLGDYIAIYTNKGFTYDLLYDDGMLFVGVKPNNQTRRIAWCETYSTEE